MIQQVNIKTLFFVAMSAVLILILSFMNFSNAISIKGQMKELKTSIELSVDISNLVHSLQKERGLCVGYLTSNAKNFSDELKEHIEISNENIERLKILHNAKNHDHILYKFLDVGFHKLEDINEVRDKVFALSMSRDEAIEYYTEINAFFLSAIADITAKATLPMVMNMLVSYSNLLYLQESVGQERALSTSILTNKTLTKIDSADLSTKIISQRIYKDTFLHYASEDIQKFYAKTLDINNVNEIKRIREFLINGEKKSYLSIEPKYWFDTISLNIDSLKQVDRYFVSMILKEINTRYNDTSMEYYFNMLMGVLALLLGIGSFIFYVSRENKHLKELKNSNDSLKQQVEEKTQSIQEQKYELELLVLAFDKNIIFSKTDLNGIITHASDAFCEISGYRRDELVGKPHNIIRHPDVSSEIFEEMWKAIQSSACWFGEIKNRKKDGSYYWVSSCVEPDYDHEGHHIGYFAVRHDITDKKALEVAMQTKSDFLANMSHEIRTPLNAIIGFVDILHKYERDQDKTKKLKIVKDSGCSLLTIINDILDFSKIENNKLLIEQIPFSIEETFTQVAELFYEKAQEHDVTIDLLIDERLPNQSMGDEVRLKQVISNLLSNAIKFSSKQCIVNIKVNYVEDTNELLCEVVDKGIGISPDKLDSIFESFTQENSSTTRKYGGTGLGLSISKAIIKLMGGEIGVKSVLNIGSSFYFTLPIHIVDTEIFIEKEVEEELELKELSGSVLIVEDNKANQMLMKLLLDEFGLKYGLANDGLEAIEAVQRKKYDLILMDENMPNMNGIEASEKIKKLNAMKEVPIIAVTANALKGDKEKFLDSGMSDYLSKPIDAKELERLLRKYL